MVTYRKEQTRSGWHRPWPLRVLFVLLGLTLVFAGMVAWSLETEYGGDPDRQEYVVAQEVGEPVQVHGEGGVVFEGTQDEVDAWLEAQRGSRNYAVAILLLVGGALLIILGVSPSPLKREPEPARPAEVVALT